MYVGDFASDIARCNSMSPTDVGAPGYKALLKSLQTELEIMQRLRQISLSVIPTKNGRLDGAGGRAVWIENVYRVERIG